MSFALPSEPGVAHFVGVGGVGMAGLANLLRLLGWKTGGCDAARGELLDWLAASGVDAVCPHDPAHIAAARPDIVIRTPAVRDSNPELAAARAAGIPVVPRGEVLAALSGRIPTYAVCGSHGKTTTATFLASVLRRIRPESTGWCIGGTSKNLPEVSGGSPETLVVEADESDGSLALYAPELTVVTNIDLDHVDRFASVSEFEKVFSSVIARTRGPVVFCADHPRTVAVCTASRHARVSFGFSPSADYRIVSCEPGSDGLSSVFSLAVPGRSGPLRVELPAPGRHNALNAAAAVAAAAALGIPADAAARALEETAALPARRFETVGRPDGFTVISDYSHHPSEIRALVRTAAALPHKRLRAVFQPHRYTRTRTFLNDFPDAFRGADELVICPVYAASEDPVPGGSAADLYAACRARRIEAPDAFPHAVFAESAGDAFAYVAATLERGDALLVVGAGDVNALAPRLATCAPVDEPPRRIALSAYGTLAPVADYRIARSPADLRAALAEAPALRVIGGGTNTLAAETGCTGTVVRLGGGFSSIDLGAAPCADAAGAPARRVTAGAAVPGPRLLAFCREHGLSGLEPMTGIPGSVGGWLAMNAGTRFGSFCDRVESVRVMRRDGAEAVLSRADLNASYRACPGLGDAVALSVTLVLTRAPKETVAERESELSRRRLDFSGLRTCGSVFKNPPAGADGAARSAGQLSDHALCKGLRVGGARVTARHANVIDAGAGATASDVLALMHIVRDRVRRDSGVELVPEIRILK